MGSSHPKQDLSDVQFDITFASKTMQRESKKAEAAEKSEKKKVAEAIRKGKLEIARIHAEGAIRSKKEAINLERLAAKMDAVGKKIGDAYRMQQVSSTMARSVPLLQNAIKDMDKIGINESMLQFEKLFEDLDVKATDMNAALDGVYQSAIDQNDVDTLVRQVADEHQLELGKEMADAGTGKVGAAAPAKEGKNDLNDIEARLNNLKQM